VAAASSPGTDEVPVASGLGVLRDRNFWPYFAGNLLSNCGTWFQNLAQTLLVYRLTGSTLAVGVVNFSQFVGTFVLAPWAGAAADRFDRRRLMIVTQLVSFGVSATLAALAAAGLVSPPVVIALALVLGIATAFAVPAMQALVPLLVPDHELAGAVALNSVTFNLARAVGPVLGAVVIGHLGIATAIGLNSLSYLALVAALVAVHPRAQAPRPKARPKLRESLALVRADARLTALLLAVLALSLTSDPVSTLSPGFATRLFHQPDTLVGWLLGAFGAGAVLAAFTVGRVGERVERRLAASLALLGGGMVGFALSPGVAVAVPALLVGGFGFLAANTMATTAIHLEVEDAQRGRVMAIWSVAFLGLRPFGSLTDGAVASVAGLRPAALLLSVPALFAAARFGLRSKGVEAGGD
jgi:MFS family permease